jgi:ABC-type Fe3+/spermidine/putrescine transport system ATPase subunit
MIEIKDITKVFDKRGIAGLHGVSFSLTEGKILSVIGPNGSGKTTLLKILSGEVHKDSGSLKIDGNVCLFPKNEELPSKNVQKFLIESITLDIDEEKKIQLARDLADTFEFTFQLRQNLNELSSGQKQKVLLSRELINRPALLLMDEPFTHLDPFTRKEILNGLFQYIRHQGITVLWVTHDLDEAFKFSDEIAVLNFGKIEQYSDPVSLVRYPRNLFVAQFIGYRNFFPVKLVEGKWTSPWGSLEAKEQTSDHAILVVPDYAWKIGQGPLFTILSRYGNKQGIEYECDLNGQKIYVQSSPAASVLEINAQMSFVPEKSFCLVIPL